MDFKIYSLVYRSLSGTVPSYLAADCQLVSDEARRRLRSANSRTCVIRRTYSQFSDRRFATAGPKLWNSLSVQLRQADVSYEQFKWLLKIFCWVYEIAVHCDYSVKLRLSKLPYLLNYLLTDPLSVPRVRPTFTSRGFGVAAPAVCNSLPSGIRNSFSAHTFRRLLKTHCFQQAFSPPYRLTQVPQIRPLADIVYSKYLFTYLHTYLVCWFVGSSCSFVCDV